MLYYSSLNKDAPQLSNTWGDFNKMINYLLDGGNEKSVVSLESIESNRVTMSMIDLPFAKSETIEITGSSNPDYNRKYYIESVNVVDNTAVLFNSQMMSILPIDRGIDIKAKIVKCGMIKKFGGITEQRTVFKSANGMEYRIDDRDYTQLMNPPITFQPHYQKICRVSMSTNYDTLDSNVDRIAPYDDSRPQENFTPSGNYVGQNYFVYNQSSNSKTIGITVFDTPTKKDNTNFQRGYMDWEVFADNRVLYINIISKNYTSCSHKYILGEYNTHNNISSALIYSHNFNGSPYNYTGTLATSNAINIYNGTSMYSISPSVGSYVPQADTASPLIYNNTKGYSKYNVYFRPTLSMNNSSDPTYRVPSGDISLIPNIDGSLLFSDIMICDNAVPVMAEYASDRPINLYGILIDNKWINSPVEYDHGSILNIDGEYYKVIYHFGSYNTNYIYYHTRSRYLIKLDIQ